MPASRTHPAALLRHLCRGWCALAILACHAALGQQMQPRRVSLAEVARINKAGTGETVTVNGLMMMETAPGYFFFHDDTGNIRVHTPDGVRQNYKPGDRLEITGRCYDNKGPWIEATRAVILGNEPLPPPVEVRANEATPEQHASSYIKVRGEVTGHTQFVSKYFWNNGWRNLVMDCLYAKCDGIEVRIIFHERENALALFPVGTEADFSGMCRLEIQRKDGVENAREMHVVVDGPKGVNVLRYPPWWTRPQVQRALLIITAVLGGIVVIGVAWVLLRRRAEMRLRQQNELLENRVAERTGELAHANERLATALRVEKELGELRANFVSLVSHEFRTPLEVILTSSDILERYFDRLDPEKRTAYLHTIHESVKRMGGMMEDVLLLGRVEEGKVQFKPDPLDLAMLAHQVVDEMHSATTHRCPIELTLCGDLTGGFGDDSLLRHIFSNVLSNATKYSPEGTLVTFRIHREGNDAVITIADKGRGIPLADRDRLFQSFQRGTNVADTQGTGLGLLIVKKCVEIHRGNIEMESEEGNGTTFVITLPLFEQPPPAVL